MHAEWQVIDSGPATVKANMDLDKKLLEELNDASLPILHLYDWVSPSATYGHFINPATYLSPEAFNCLDLSKRPTGGGVTFHVADWAFSVLVPANYHAYSLNTLDNYAFVNQLVIEVLSRFLGGGHDFSLLHNESQALDPHSGHFCMAKPTKYDVMLGGKKVGGGAQRRTRTGFLHQGTISLSLPDRDFLAKVLLPGTCVYESMSKNTCTLLPKTSSVKDLVEARHFLKQLFTKVLLE